MRLLPLVIACALTVATGSVTAHERIPARANAYRGILTREARTYWGLNANIAMFAAQIHQESAWNPNAKSWVGAEGLGQFMPGTASDMNRVYRNQLGQLELNSPLWSIRALVIYDKEIYDGLKAVGDAPFGECSRWSMTFSGYNGGPGWVDRDRRLTKIRGKNPNIWADNVALYSSRGRAAFDENRAYPQRIIYQNLPLYLSAGWIGEQPCTTSKTPPAPAQTH